MSYFDRQSRSPRDCGNISPATPSVSSRSAMRSAESVGGAAPAASGLTGLFLCGWGGGAGGGAAAGGHVHDVCCVFAL